MRKTLLFAALLGGIAAVGLVWRAGVRPAAPEGCAASPGAARVADPAGPRIAAAPLRPTPAPPMPPKNEVVRRSLADVLPGLAAPVADWRNFRPDHLTVVPIPGVALQFAATRIVAEGRYTLWTGANGAPGVTLNSSGTADRWDAVVTVPGALEYDIHVSAAGVTVEKIDFGSERCEAGTAPAMVLPAAAAQAAPAADTTVYTSDLLVLYTTAAANALGGAAATENTVRARIASGNTYLAQSQVNNISWNLVGVVEVTDYTETGNLDTDLNNLVSTRTSLGTFAQQQGRLYGADQVMLLVSHSNDNFAGEAMTPGVYSVALVTGSAGIIAHELGHNFGCHHDRQTENAPDNDGRYYYAYRWTDASNRDVGTIMSYASYRIPYFSNPNLTYSGHIIGLAAGDPKAADNERVLRENAAFIANLRPSASGPPSITSQPMSVTVMAGQSFSLSVTASGPALTYGWAHDGMTIPTATGSSYSVASATTADGGTYVVTVANSSGSVPSNPATVTVTPAGSTPPPQTPSGSTSGGGGGGALDPGTALAALLVVLGYARRARGRPER